MEELFLEPIRNLKMSSIPEWFLRREFALAHTKHTGMWWFDFFGGYYYAKELMDEVTKMVVINQRLKDIPMHSTAEIVVFGDVESMYYVSEFARLNHDCLRNMRDILGRIGAPYNIYTFSDIENVCFDRYKLCIFLNTFKMSHEAKSVIEDKVKKNGRSILWIYAPAYITDTGFSTKNMNSITGFNLSEADICNSEVISGGKSFSFTEKVEPLFKVVDENAIVLWKVFRR